MVIRYRKMVSEVEVLSAFESEFPAVHFLHFERILKILMYFLMNILCLLFVVRGKSVALDLLESLNLDSATNDAQIVVGLALFLLLHDLIAHVHQFLGQDAAFHFQLKILLVFFLSDVLFVDVDTFVDIFDAVLVELIKPEERFIGR